MTVVLMCVFMSFSFSFIIDLLSVCYYVCLFFDMASLVYINWLIELIKCHSFVGMKNVTFFHCCNQKQAVPTGIANFVQCTTEVLPYAKFYRMMPIPTSQQRNVLRRRRTVPRRLSRVHCEQNTLTELQIRCRSTLSKSYWNECRKIQLKRIILNFLNVNN